MKQITATAFKEVVEAERNNKSVDFINVCTPAEYNESYIEGVRSFPLDEMESRLSELEGKSTIYIHCRSGNRGRQAAEKLTALGIKADLVNVEGGLMAWTEAGFAVNSITNRLPIMRQVMIVAGLLVLLGYILSALGQSYFIFLSVAMGAGLLFAGLSGWCGLSVLLSKMPWNK